MRNSYELRIRPGISEIGAIYDRVYANPGLMGTNLDEEYSRVTKTILLEYCRAAPNNHLLDLGTGDGDLWQYADVALDWHAVDISAVGLQRARSRFPALKTVAKAITEQLPYPSGYFGAVISADTLEHVFDLPATLREIRRVLTPGGCLAMSVPTPDSLRKWAHNRFIKERPSLRLAMRLGWVVIQRALLFGQPTFQPIDRDLTVEEWRNLLIDADFSILSQQVWPAPPLKPIVLLLLARSSDPHVSR